MDNLASDKGAVVQVEHASGNVKSGTPHSVILDKPSGKDSQEATEFVINNAGYYSTLDELSFWKTVRCFKMAAAVCFSGSFGALSDNYQLSVPGQILALPGFIQTFGVPDASAPGGKSLPTSRVSGWGGE